MQMPDYSHITDRGRAISSMVQNAFNIMAQTLPTAVRQYQNQRSIETAYKGIRGMILENQEKFGLDDNQADSLMTKLKYHPDETIDDYEKRVSGPLTNMKVYDIYSNDADYEIDMPDPFLDLNSFASAMDHYVKIKKQRAVGEAVQKSVFGDGGGIPEGTDISNIQSQMEKIDLEAYQGPQRGVTQPETREQARMMVAGEMGTKPVSEKELEQFPSYRALPTQEELGKQDIQSLKKQETEANIDLKKEQLESQKALTRYRNTSARVKALSKTSNKRGQVGKFKDLSDIVKMETAARELLKDIPREDPAGGISEEWLDMKELADVLKEKRNEIVKQTEGGKREPSMEANALADQIQQEASSMFNIKDPNEHTIKGVDELTAQRINQFALSKGVSVDFVKIKQALQEGKTAAEIIDRILMKLSQGKQSSRPEQLSQRIGGKGG